MAKRIKILMKKDIIIKLFPHLDTEPIVTTHELGLFGSGAKLYKSAQPGVWIISGYACSGEDVRDALAEILSVM